MIHKGVLFVVWYPLAIILLLVNLVLLSGTQKPARAVAILDHDTLVEPISTSLIPQTETSQVLGAHIEAGDARALLLQKFLDKHHSPMTPYADQLVQESDTNGIDFRLVVAIAMCESNLGNHMPSKDSYNAWGIAVYTGEQSGASFKSWPQAISWVSRYIKEKFYDHGIVDLKKIGAIYAPPSVNTGYSWTNCVQTFQNSIY